MFETLPFVMGFYSTSLCLIECLGSAILLLNLLDLYFWSYGPFTVVMHSLFEQLVPKIVGFCLRWAKTCYFWKFGERANRANVFPVFPYWSKGLLENYLYSVHPRVNCSVYGILRLLGTSDLFL